MKLRHLIILLFAIGIVAPLKAQDHIYAGMGFSKQATSIRLGYIPETFGGEIHVKLDNNRLFKSIPEMQDRRYRFSLMAGANVNLGELLLITANLGYGSRGIYQVSATGDEYGVSDLYRGLEAGVVVDVAFGVFTLYIGWSHIFSGKSVVPTPTSIHDEIKLSEWTFGFGFLL